MRGGAIRRWPSVVGGAAAGLALVFASCGGGSSKTAALIVYEAKATAGDAGAPSYTPGPGDAGAYMHIYTVDPTTAKTVQLTSGAYNDANPGWSPDRSQIIFKSDRDRQPGQDDIYVMRADGSDVRRLTDTPDVTKWTPKFSPDGRLVVYVQVVRGEGSFLALMDADGSGQRRVAGPYGFTEFPSWTRDGSEVFFSAIERGRSDADIYAYNLASGSVRTVIATPAADVCPHFTYDGATLTYASIAPGDENKGNVDLFAHDLTSGDTTGASDRRLTTAAGIDDYGNPGPGGGEMVFISKRGATADLWLMGIDGSDQRVLVETPGLDENVPDW